MSDKPMWRYIWGETGPDQHIADVLNKLAEEGYKVRHIHREGHTYEAICELEKAPKPANEPEPPAMVLLICLATLVGGAVVSLILGCLTS